MTPENCLGFGAVIFHNMEPTGFLGLQTSPECRSSLLQAPFCLHLYLIYLISFWSWQGKVYRISRDLLAKVKSFMWTYVVPHWRDQITTHIWWLMIPTKASVSSHSSHWPLMTLLALLWPCFSAALAKNLQPSFKEQSVEMGGGEDGATPIYKRSILTILPLKAACARYLKLGHEKNKLNKL